MGLHNTLSYSVVCTRVARHSTVSVLVNVLNAKTMNFRNQRS